MRTILGLSALLLGSALLAGAADAQNNNNNNSNSPPTGWHWNSGSSHVSHSPPPSGQGNPGNGHGNPGALPNAAGRPNFTGQHTGLNRAQWNHIVTFHDRNVAHFNTQDRAMWTHGQWRHTKHNGRNGWWWYTNGAWFFYDEPTYPYPDDVSDYYAFDDDYADAPAQGGYVWYYCSNPPGYYPYIQSCRGPWQPVAPTPPAGNYDQGPQQGPPNADQDDDDRGPPPGQSGQYDDQQGGPPPGYSNDDNDSDQGPPPSGYDNDQGPPQGDGPPPGDDQPPPR